MSHVRGIATLVAFVAALVISIVALANDAHASEQPVVTTRHSVLKHSVLKDCRHTQVLPCSLFDGIDSGWLELDAAGQPVWHSVWMHDPRHGWHWATRAERQRYGLTLDNQVKRVRGHVTAFRGPTGELWFNVPGTDSEHWPS